MGAQTSLPKVHPDFVVHLGGRPFPMYVGVLAVAHEEGLRELTVKIIQAPSKENEYRCIAEATAVLVKDNERHVFTDVGDANPRNCSAKVATALERMASTRAQGRALRAAINLGYTLLEELPEDEARELRDKAKAENGNGNGRPVATAPNQTEGGRTQTARPNQASAPPAPEEALPPAEPDPEPEFDEPEASAPPAMQAPPPATNGPAANGTIAAKICSGCKRALTGKQRDDSVAKFNKPLCPLCSRDPAKI